MESHSKNEQNKTTGHLCFFLSLVILFILPVLCEILPSNFCSNGKILKFDKEITKAKMLKYMVVKRSGEF